MNIVLERMMDRVSIHLDCADEGAAQQAWDHIVSCMLDGRNLELELGPMRKSNDVARNDGFVRGRFKWE
jgi:hypothetical protein